MGPTGRIGHILYILDCLGQVYAGLYLGRALRTKETLPDFLKWRRVTRPPLVFRGLTGSQQTPGFWGVTHMCMHKDVCIPIVILILECMKFVTYSHSIGVLRVLLCSSHVPHCHSFSSPSFVLTLWC